jgi:hypothetical protein
VWVEPTRLHFHQHSLPYLEVPLLLSKQDLGLLHHLSETQGVLHIYERCGRMTFQGTMAVVVAGGGVDPCTSKKSWSAVMTRSRPRSANVDRVPPCSSAFPCGCWPQFTSGEAAGIGWCGWSLRSIGTCYCHCPLAFYLKDGTSSTSKVRKGTGTQTHWRLQERSKRSSTPYPATYTVGEPKRRSVAPIHDPCPRSCVARRAW